MKKFLSVLILLAMLGAPLLSWAGGTLDGNFADADTAAITKPEKITFLDERNGWVGGENNLLENFYSCTSPETVYVPDYDYEGGYPYRMFFYGWAYTQGNEPAAHYEGYPGGDAIFCARAESIYGPWEVWSRNPETLEGYWDTTMTPYFWCPVVTCAEGVWYDSWHVADATVVYHDGTFYLMTSSQGTDVDGKFGDFDPGDTDGYSGCVLGAISPDGINWTKADGPLLIWEHEMGFDENAVGGWYTGNGYYGALGQPSLLYEDGVWKCWFTYNCSVRSAMWGYAENRGDFMNPNDWQFVRYWEDPLTSIKGCTDFDVVKIGDLYCAFANTWLNYYGLEYDYLLNYPKSDWRNMASVCITQFLSFDGFEWFPVGYFYPDDDAPSATCPQVMFDPKTRQLCVFYAVTRGDTPGISWYDWRWYTLRVRTCDIQTATQNYTYYDPPAPKESWEIHYAHQSKAEGGSGKIDPYGRLLPFESETVKITIASGFDQWFGQNTILNGFISSSGTKVLGSQTRDTVAEITDGKLQVTSCMGNDGSGSARVGLCTEDAQMQAASRQAARSDGIGFYLENNTANDLGVAACFHNGYYVVNQDNTPGYFIGLDGLCTEYTMTSSQGITVPAGARGYIVFFNEDLKGGHDYNPETAPIGSPGVRFFGLKVDPAKNENVVVDNFFFFGISNQKNDTLIRLNGTLHVPEPEHPTATPTAGPTAEPSAPPEEPAGSGSAWWIAVLCGIAAAGAAVILAVRKKKKQR